MFKEFSNNDKEDDYLSEFRQKIATQNREDIEQRRHELQRSRNGFIGTLAGIALAALVSWFLLIPRFSQNEPAELPIIRRPMTPAKIQPNEPGGMEILNQDKSVYNLVEKKEAAPEKIESLLPPPETPKLPVIVPEPETTQTAAKNESEELAAANEKTVNTTNSKDSDPLKIIPLNEKIVEVESTSGQKIAIPEKLPKIEIKPKTVDKAHDVIPDSAKSNAPTESVAVANKSTTPISGIQSSEIWQVQLMASSNKSSLEKGWRELSAKYGILKQQPHEIETTANGTANTIHRLKAGSFSERSGADKLCAEIKKSGGSCLVKKK